MSKNDSNIKIPFIVKDILIGRVKISSVFTSDTEIITFERLKYLIDTEQIELLNAYIDTDKVVFTNDFKYIKKNKKVVSNILHQKINLYDVLTSTQKELSKIFNGSAFELDIETSCQLDTNEIYSKPLRIMPGHSIIVCVRPGYNNFADAKVYFGWTNDTLYIRDATTESFIKLISLFKNPSSLTDIDGLCSKILEEYLTNGLRCFAFNMSTTLEDIKNRCDIFGIYEEYHSMLQNRINITKSYSELIERLRHVTKVEHDVDLPSVESLILYFTFYVENIIATNVKRSIEWEIDKVVRNAGQYRKKERTEYFIKFCDEVNKYGDVKEILTKYDLHI